MDRIDIIRKAAEKVNKQIAFRRKMKALQLAAKLAAEKQFLKEEKALMRLAENADDRSKSDIYDSEKAVAQVISNSGIVEKYQETTRFDNEWN